MRQFNSKQQQFNAGVRVMYKRLRRNGATRGAETYAKAKARAAGLFASFATLEASDYKACPIALAAVAAAANAA